MADRENRLKGRAVGAFLCVLEALAGLVVLGSLTGCVVVGASSRGGLFIWPGGVGLVVLILLVVLVLRRR